MHIHLMKLSIIVAFDENRLIGNNNNLPWHLPADLRHFKKITMGHHMIMGRRTFESIGKPLPGRTSVIVTRQKNYMAQGCIIVNSLDEALLYCNNQDEVFIIGGAQIFECALPLAAKLYVTRILQAFKGDTWFPEISGDEWEVVSAENHNADEKNEWKYSFLEYVRK